MLARTHIGHVGVSEEDEEDEQDSILAEIYNEELRYKECDITFQVGILNDAIDICWEFIVTSIYCNNREDRSDHSLENTNVCFHACCIDTTT